jgi:TonB family protein
MDEVQPSSFSVQPCYNASKSLMYFDFDDLHPDTPRLLSPLTQLEKVLLTVVAHLAVVILILVWPHLPFVKAMEARQQQALEEQQRRQLEDLRNRREFVFIAPKIDIETKVPQKLADLSDKNRRAQTVERSPDPKNNLPFSRGNSPERVEGSNGPKPTEQPEPTPPARGDANSNPAPVTDPNALVLPDSPLSRISKRDDSNNSSRGVPTGVLSEAIKNVQRYAKSDSLQNVQAGNGDFGPSIQFDSKGVEFGPWIRRFQAQIYRNWFVPYAAMSLRGHVVLSFYVHKDGTITDLQVLKPSVIDAFTKSAVNAIRGCNPTMPLPPEYPDEKALFTVTFYFNEYPPSQ